MKVDPLSLENHLNEIAEYLNGHPDVRKSFVAIEVK
jgi:hypothetical protein